jgi:hypothetical protein
VKRPMALYVYVKYLLILAGANFCVLKNEILRAKGLAFNRSSGRRIVVHSRGGPQWGCLLGNQTRFVVADFLIAILRPSQLGSATN